MEEKLSSIVWHYRKADQEFGDWKAHQLAEELAALTVKEQIEVRHDKKIVEVTAAQVNKGAAVASILKEDKAYEIALCAGDDQTDESMFKLSAPRLLSVKVGEGPTKAQFRVANPAAFRRFLDEALMKL